MVGRDALRNSRRPVTIHLNVVFERLSLGNIIGGLEPNPRFRRGTECLGKPDRHSRRDACVPVHEIRKGLATDAEHPGAVRYAEAQRLQA